VRFEEADLIIEMLSFEEIPQAAYQCGSITRLAFPNLDDAPAKLS
jgi:hypothetical protein